MFFCVNNCLAQEKWTCEKSKSGANNQIKIIQNKIPDALMYNLLAAYPQYFDSIIKDKDEMRIQIIYTEVNRSKKGKPKFIDHFFNHNPDKYFYPASTIKLPIAILALQRLNELKIPGLNKYTTMLTGAEGDGQTEVNNDPSSPDGRPTIAHYIKKILLVSDNDASNRLYEFLGQEYINNSLHKMGYTNVQIIHRLSISLTEDQNRHTNPVCFIDSAGNIIYKKKEEISSLVYQKNDVKLGKGYYKESLLINEPFDFSAKNVLPLFDLHLIIRSIIFPESVPEKQRFNLTTDDYKFLRRYMSMLPNESQSPVYNPEEYWDTYVKFLYYGSEKGMSEQSLRIFNKVGDAYGFLIDAAYIIDLKNNIEFMLSAAILCNSDSIFNDDKYDYDNVGFPFMKNLGRVVYDYELKRKRKHLPDLSTFRFQYSN